tara:strand:- start:733 stop:1098 length:366 start_codon:yes stop_codon:yes gene_type:complete
MNVDTDKLIELLIKYKTQVSYLIAFIACVGCFVGGYNIQKCKPKSEVCRAEELKIGGLQAELAAKDEVRVQQLRDQRDEDRQSCDARVEAAKQGQRAANDFLGCSDICALHPQCVEAGRCR